MLNVEIKINGNMIGFINIGRIETFVDEDTEYEYNYRIIMPAIDERHKDILVSGNVFHKYSDGALALIQHVIENSNWEWKYE